MEIGADVFMMTAKGLMPGQLVDIWWDGPTELYDVESHQGRRYTTIPCHVYAWQEGRAILRERRAQDLARDGYEIALRTDGTYRVWNEAKHGQTGGYIVTPIRGAEGEFHCTCPAYAKEGCCKHESGVAVLLWAKAAEAAAEGKAAHVQTYAERAASAAFPESQAHRVERERTERRERVLASIGQDF